METLGVPDMRLQPAVCFTSSCIHILLVSSTLSVLVARTFRNFCFAGLHSEINFNLLVKVHTYGVICSMSNLPPLSPLLATFLEVV